MSIDLATDCGLCGPCEVSKPDDKYYPSFHYDGDKELDIPEEGTMVIKFKRTGRSESERNGKTRYSCSIDVCSIESVDGDEVSKPAESYDDASSALDKIVELLKKENE
jgi:hypothetical protein